MENSTAQPLLTVTNLKKYFRLKRPILDAIARKPIQTLKAVDDVSFSIAKGETLGLVGESGCGKSTLARTIMRLYDPDAGKVVLNGIEISSLKGKELREKRRSFQMVFQDPYSSLNPRMTVRDTLGEALKVHKVCPPEQREQRILKLLEMVGMNADTADRYPGEFSGGQRQRIGIARALALDPAFIIADEPVSDLDVSIQAQIINLLMDLQKDLELTMLFISHDLRVVRLITHRVAVMYLGKIIELAPTEELYERPYHPYTEVLLKAAPVLDPTHRSQEYSIEGEPPSPIQLPTGCRFHPRCPRATEECKKIQPDFAEVCPGHWVACHHPIQPV